MRTLEEWKEMRSNFLALITDWLRNEVETRSRSTYWV